MTWNELLEHLAAWAGIEPFYFDVFGKRHDTSQEAKVLLLEALGINVASAAAAQTAWEAAEYESWNGVLPPTLVRPAREPYVDFVVASEDEERTVAWELACENGETHRGSARPSELPQVAVREGTISSRIRHRLVWGALPAGYHRLTLHQREGQTTTLILTPTQCHMPSALGPPDGKAWGVAGHLYTLRGSDDWGIGDFGDLERLCRIAGGAGATAMAVNPLHALFPNRPDAASPYSPSSRLFLNPIYIDLRAANVAIPAPATCEALRAASHVDYAGVWQAKSSAFERLFAAAHANGLEHDPAFARFVGQGGMRLAQFAAFSVLQEEHGNLPWPRWPTRMRNPDQGSRHIADTKPERVTFHRYLQFLAEHQFAKAAQAACESGMGIGIVRDLALGLSPDGADAWMDGAVYGRALRCGAPPDEFQPQGQEWGVLPFHPLRLRRDFRDFAQVIAANMRWAGGLRVDHVIGLQRQFLVPVGAKPAAGAYVRSPFAELLGILALESQRNECLVVGEDLGTVPEGFRDRMAQANIFGCSVLYFERAVDGGFLAPDHYRAKSVATVGTHDLSTLADFCTGRDIALRQELGIYDKAEAEGARADRADTLARLRDALTAAGFAEEWDGTEAGFAALRHNAHGFLAHSAAYLFLAQLDDLLGERGPVNVPGTTDAYPNWRRKLSGALDDPRLADALHELADICRSQARGGG